MANFKRNRSRSKPSSGYSANGLTRRLDGKIPAGDRKRWTGTYPRFWDILHHSRPARRSARALEKAVLAGEDADGVCWPDGRKPHTYYW